MGSCKYKVNKSIGGLEAKDGYEYSGLIEGLENIDASSFGDLLFSQEIDRQTPAVKKIIQAKLESYNRKAANTVTDGEPGADVSDGMTTQEFIDSSYFTVEGDAPTFRMDMKQYLELMKSRYVENGYMTPESAERWGDLVTLKWGRIADDARALHTMLGPQTASDGRPIQKDMAYWTRSTANTSFQGIPSKCMEADRRIFSHVAMTHGPLHYGDGRKARIISNVSLKTDINGIDEKLYGHIDYVAVNGDGSLDIYNVKTSMEPPGQWASAKWEKYKHQAALLKRMLANNGVDVSMARVHVIPVQVVYNDTFDQVNDVRVHQPIAMDMKGSVYSFGKYDRTAAQYVESKVNKIELSEATTQALVDASNDLKHIFPEDNIRAQGVMDTAKEWADKHWTDCLPKELPGKKGWTLTMPDTGEKITLKDPASRGKNEEFVKLIEDRLDRLTDSVKGDFGAKVIVRDLKTAFKQYGFPSSSLTGSPKAYIDAQFTKYFKGKKVIGEGSDRKFDYRWELIENDALTEANMIMFRNRDTDQVDVICVTNVNPDLLHRVKGRKNLLNSHITDSSSYATIDCTYGNIEAMRATALLNRIVPALGGNIKLGELHIINPNPYNSRKGVKYEFDTVLKMWKNTVNVVNKCDTQANLTDNFRRNGITYVDPGAVLYQTLEDIYDDDTVVYPTPLDTLRETLKGTTKVDNTAVLGLMGINTIEGKLIKLREFMKQLTDLCDTRGIPYGRPKDLVAKTREGGLDGAIANLYLAASKALAVYSGDMPAFNEKFSQINEMAMRPTSVNNSAFRRVVYLTNSTIDIIRGKVTQNYMYKAGADGRTPFQMIKDYYKDCGYTEIRNATVGDQAKMWDRLYQKDENGKNLYLFKNPYDSDSDLNEYERKFLKNILYEFYKVRVDMRHAANAPGLIKGPNDPALNDVSTMPANYLFVPLQRATKATQRVDFKTRLGNKYESMKSFFENRELGAERLRGMVDQADVERRDVEIEELRAYNPYTRSEMSANERDVMLSERPTGWFETNLENIFIDFMGKQVECEEYQKLLLRINAIETALMVNGVVEDDEAAINHTVKAIDDYVKENIYNKSIMEKKGQVIDAIIGPLRRMVSKFYIAMNPVGMVRDTMQGLENSFLHAALKFQTDIDAKDVAFAYKTVFQDSIKGATDGLMMQSLLNQFNIKYGLANFDASRVTERLHSNRGGIMNYDNMIYLPLRLPDYVNRLVLFVAKMHHDGAFEAYSLDEAGRLKYDWRKDRRFSALAKGDESDPEYKKQKGLYQSLIRAFNTQMESGLAYTDDLPDAYTPATVRSMKTIGESIYGAYDKSMKAKYEATLIGHNFLFFTTWMSGMVDNYFSGRMTDEGQLELQQETDYNGNPLYFTDDTMGETTTTNTGIPVMNYMPVQTQGIFNTINEVARELKNSGYSIKEFRETDTWKSTGNRANLRKALADLLVVMIFGLSLKLFITPAYRRRKAEADGKKLIQNALVETVYYGFKSSYDNFKGPAAVVEYLGESTNPATYRLQTKVVGDLAKVFTGKKSIGQAIIGGPAAFRGLRDSYQMFLRDKDKTVIKK